MSVETKNPTINIADLPTTEGSARRQAEAWIVAKAQSDESYRKRLMSDPRGVVSQELGIEFPRDYKINVVQETAKSMYLVLPAAAARTGQGELSDQDLEAVAGGKTSTPPVTGGDPHSHTLTMTTSGGFVTDPGGDNAGLN